MCRRQVYPFRLRFRTSFYFVWSWKKIQSIASLYHREQSHRRLFAVQGVFITPWYAYTVNPCVSVVLLGTSRGVCPVGCSPLQLFFFFFFFFFPSTPSPLLPLLLVNRHISIFISGLPQLLAVKCLQASFFFFFYPHALPFSASIFSPRACFMHKVGYLTSDVIHVHEWNTTKKSIISLLLLPTSNFLNVPVLIRVMHYARNGYFDKLIEPSEQQPLASRMKARWHLTGPVLPRSLWHHGDFI